MSSPVLCDGDEATFEPMFGPRQVVLSEPAILTGTGVATISGRRTCAAGDEQRAQWPAQYFIAGYSPGAGIVSIEMLDASQTAPYVAGQTPLMLQGTGAQFTARFTPTAPAVMASTPFTPDTTAPGMGRGTFIAHQQFVRA
jgi:hypothetical protein